jgi:pimeloyl-ACP methyl ester carboxylesterase
MPKETVMTTRFTQRPLVVLLHSSASSARQWDALIERLQPRFLVRAIEFHGHGAQPDWRGDAALTLADEVRLITPLMAEARGAHIIGHSYGAAVALKLATLYPGWVRSLVAYEPVLFGLLFGDSGSRVLTQQITGVAAGLRTLLAHGDPLAAAARFVGFWSGAAAWAAMSTGRQSAVAARIASVLAHFDALFSEPLQREQLARLRAPMLFLAGAATVGVTRRIADLLDHALPFAAHESLPRMGHMGPITHAAEVNQRIDRFLQAQLALDCVIDPVNQGMDAPQRFRADPLAA